MELISAGKATARAFFLGDRVMFSLEKECCYEALCTFLRRPEYCWSWQSEDQSYSIWVMKVTSCSTSGISFLDSFSMMLLLILLNLKLVTLLLFPSLAADDSSLSSYLTSSSCRLNMESVESDMSCLLLSHGMFDSFAMEGISSVCLLWLLH